MGHKIRLPLGSIIGGLAAITISATVIYHQYRQIKACKSDFANLYDEQRQVYRQLEQAKVELSVSRQDHKEAVNAQVAINDQLSSKVRHLNKVALYNIILAEGRKRRSARILKNNRRLYAFGYKYICELQASIQCHAIKQVESNNRYAALAALKERVASMPEVPGVPQRPQSAINIMELAKVKTFRPPADLAKFATKDFPFTIRDMVEIFKQMERAKRAAGDKTAKTESAVMAESAYWTAKGMVPNSWLTWDVPQEVVARVRLGSMYPGKPTRKAKPAMADPHHPHENGNGVVHYKGNCPANVCDDLITLADNPIVRPIVGQSSARPSWSASTGSPNTMGPAIPLVPTLGLQTLMAEGKVHEKSLLNVTTITYGDKQAKSKTMKNNKMNDPDSK